MSPRIPSRFALLAAFALTVALVVALHGRVWNHPFISDDYIFLEETAHPQAAALLTGFGAAGNYYRSLGREFYFFAGQRLFGTNAWAFRIVNFLALAGTIVLLMLLARRVAGPRAAMLAGGVYALVYPHRVLLTWISCAQDLFATLGAAAAAFAHVESRRRLAAGLFFAALFAKESVAPLPLVLALYELWTARGERRKGPQPAPWLVALQRTWMLWAALAAWAVVVFAVRAVSKAWSQGAGTLPVADIVLEQATVLEGFRFALLTFFGLDQPGPALIAGATRVPAAWPVAALACALCGVLAWWAAHAGPAAAAVPPVRSKARKAAFATPLLVLGMAWAVLGALPVALAGHHFSAYYVTFAACGFALAAGAVLAALPWPVAAVALAAGAFGNLAANATDTFRDPATLQGRGGVSYVTFARLDWEARYLKELRRMIGVRPVQRGTQIFIGNVPLALGAATAGNLAPRVWFADSTLTLDYVSKFRMRDPARPTLTLRFDRDTWKFVELPEALETAIADGEANLLAGHIALARQQLERALELAPESTNAFERKGIANNLGMAQAMTGDTAAAAVSWQIAATLDPTLREPQMNLATLEIQRHQPARARLRLDAVLAHNGADPTALWYRTLAANAMGDTASALSDFERLVKLDPHYADSVIAVARKLRR